MSVDTPSLGQDGEGGYTTASGGVVCPDLSVTHSSGVVSGLLGRSSCNDFRDGRENA